MKISIEHSPLSEELASKGLIPQRCARFEMKLERDEIATLTLDLMMRRDEAEEVAAALRAHGIVLDFEGIVFAPEVSDHPGLDTGITPKQTEQVERFFRTNAVAQNVETAARKRGLR